MEDQDCILFFPINTEQYDTCMFKKRHNGYPQKLLNGYLNQHKEIPKMQILINLYAKTIIYHTGIFS